MRTLTQQTIQEAVEKLAVEACLDLPADVEQALRRALQLERTERGLQVLEQIVRNAEIARQERIPICQDTGIFNVFLDLGPGVELEGPVQQAVDKGIAAATRSAALRPSLVTEPLFRRDNTGDNTPAALYVYPTEEPGAVRITVMPKGGGSENVTALLMLLPTATAEEVVAEVARIVKEKAPFACPPVIVGVGMGSNADGALRIAKRALMREVGARAPHPDYRRMEEMLLTELNASGIGPGGLGGGTTALSVMVEGAPTHIACLPVGVVISCHALRRRSIEL
jgi:tartrate/fumarate subfamily iron-sulfur-dependent hydro-lyase alpha chain